MKETILSACRHLLRPIIKIILKNGVTYREFAEMSKGLYVDVAASDYGLQGRRTNISRIALITGLDRKEIKRVIDLLESGNQFVSSGSLDRITRVLSGWYQDSEFLDTNDKPKVLPLSGNDCSFATLAKRYGGDVPSSALLKELKRAEVVQETGSGALVVLKRQYIPPGTDAEGITRMGVVVGDFISTLSHNLHSQDEDAPAKFERRATNISMPPTAIPQFREYVEIEGQEFLEKIDSWLTENQLIGDEQDNLIRLGVGAYWIEDVFEKSSIEGSNNEL